MFKTGVNKLRKLTTETVIEVPKYSWEHVHRIVKAITANGIGVGATVSIRPIHIFTPTFWVDFLNSFPEKEPAMWLVYRDFTIYMQMFREWIVSTGYMRGGSIRDMVFLSREDFREIYHPEMGITEGMYADVSKVHSHMTTFLDKVDMEALVSALEGTIPEVLTGGASIPCLPFRLDIMQVGPGRDVLELDIYGADHPKFWLSVMLAAMLSACRDGKMSVRRCKNCDKFFLTSSQGLAKVFHSSSCRSTYNTRRMRRKTLV